MSETKSSLVIGPSDRRDFLTARHEAFATPTDVLDEVAASAGLGDVVEKQRIIVGESNEVYNILTNQQQELILRVSRRAERQIFEGEKAALDKCREAGIPTPRVYLITEREVNDQSLSFCAEEKLPGKPAAEVLEGNDESQKAQIIAQITELVKKMHRIPVEGFGYLDASGRGALDSWPEVMLSTAKPEVRAWLDPAFEAEGLGVSTLDRVEEILSASLPEYTDRASYLNHGDMGPTMLYHILVENGQVSGVLDFENAIGGDPIYDLARWDFYNSDKIPTAAFTDEANSPDFQKRLELEKLRLATILVAYHHDTGDAQGIELAKAKLHQGLEFFKDIPIKS